MSIFGYKYIIFQNTEAKRMSLLQKNVASLYVLRRQTWIFFSRLFAILSKTAKSFEKNQSYGFERQNNI